MPTWGELLKEANVLLREHGAATKGKELKPGDPGPFDELRRKYLSNLHEKTGRDVIVYASAFLEGKPASAGPACAITLADKQGFMEACSNLDGDKLDLFLHSPGGEADAAEAIVDYLRTQFSDIRVVVPVAAMSAATMMALAADSIAMGDHSQLGPIDPQFTIVTPEGPRSAPAQAILDQFVMAKEECQDPKNLAAWMPILRTYSPGLLSQCESAQKRAKDLVNGWLAQYMFKDRGDGLTKAWDVAEWFSDFSEFKSHGRRVTKQEAKGQSLVIEDMEDDVDLHDAYLSVHHAYQLTFTSTSTLKIIENHKRSAWIVGPQATPITLSKTPKLPKRKKGSPRSSSRKKKKR